MSHSPTIDFAHIAPRGGSQADAFEELCCQLARLEHDRPAHFQRVRGAGGDGGVECTWTMPTGEVEGWQVKFIFDLGRAITKLDASLDSALARYPDLRRYVVCLPFDLSGSRGRGGKSQVDRFEEFRTRRVAAAGATGRRLDLELWTASELRDRLLDSDPHGGRTRYWFETASLSQAWFSAQLDNALRRAGPRYNPELHTGHALDEVFAALGATERWGQALARRLEELDSWTRRWDEALASRGSSGMSEPFPAGARWAGVQLADALRTCRTLLGGTGFGADDVERMGEARALVVRCEELLAGDIDHRFGTGMADSVPFRHHQAEIQCTFPAQHLDECRALSAALGELDRWLRTPAHRAFAERTLLLTGPAGIGKTHGLCDMAVERRTQDRLTLLLDGLQFGGDRAPWPSIAGALGLSSDWSLEAFLDALDAAGELHGRVLVCIDALDERPERWRWRDELGGFLESVRRRPHLAFCASVRSGYRRQVVREDLALPELLHPGFGEAVFDACRSFFGHFGLEAPTGPLLEPEYANPLFLLTLCRTLQARGYRSVPTGWRGARQILGGLLAARDAQLRDRHPGLGARTVTDAMLALADAIAHEGPLAWARADAVTNTSLPSSLRAEVRLLDLLLGVDLLRTLPGPTEEWGPSEDLIDIAFGKLRDYLLAERWTSGAHRLEDAELLAAALEDPELAVSLAVVMPERGRGELFDLASWPEDRWELQDSWLRALPWRSPDSLDTTCEELLHEALEDEDLVDSALDAILVLALRPGHRLDHRWLHAHLLELPLARRDSFWCGYLHRSFDHRQPPSPLVRLLESPWSVALDRLPGEVAEAWCTVLAWCGAAADHRVRDHATMALVKLAQAAPWAPARLVEQFGEVDDDRVLERILCASYGALLIDPAPEHLAQLARSVHGCILRREGGAPSHALVRDHARSIGEWAGWRGVLPSDLDISDFRPPFDTGTELTAPATKDLEHLRDSRGHPRLYASIMSEWTGDFAKYTLPHALGPLGKLVDVQLARNWVLQRVLDLGYTPELHAPYDYAMIRTFGHGRGRQKWAERIGKKYQHIALAQLVGRLDDIASAEGKPTGWMAGRRLRDIDPTLAVQGTETDSSAPEAGAWREPASMDFEATRALTDSDWVAADDFPDPAALVAPLCHPSQASPSWRLIDGGFRWRDQTPGGEDRRYRDVVMRVQGFLVRAELLDPCLDVLAACDFMGQWLPDGLDMETGPFLGEFPWHPDFPELREPAETWHRRAEAIAPFDLQPTAHRLTAARGAFARESTSVCLPSGWLVDVTGTRWDGVSGFWRDDGTPVFRDWSVQDDGPAGVWMDDATLRAALAAKGVALVWAVWAERRIMGDFGGEGFRGMKHRSWVLWLEGASVQCRVARGEHLTSDRRRLPV